MNVTRSVFDFTVVIDIEREDGMMFAKASCPICGSTEDSADNGFGSDHAANITASKIRTHLILSHGYKDSDGAGDS